MPTVYERIHFNRFVVSADLKGKIGKVIAEKYFELPLKSRPPLSKRKSIEPEGTFIVWVYPKRFTKTMDLVIKEMCVGSQRLKRKRIIKSK